MPLGWREVPVDPEGANVGPASKDAQPFIAQYFIGSAENTDEKEFDRRIWSTVARVFHVQKVEGVSREDIDSTKYTIDSGKPIQRIVVRTDKSERIDAVSYTHLTLPTILLV